MIIFVSNLTAGMEEALDRPHLLLDMVKPFLRKSGNRIFYPHLFSSLHGTNDAHQNLDEGSSLGVSWSLLLCRGNQFSRHQGI